MKRTALKQLVALALCVALLNAQAPEPPHETVQPDVIVPCVWAIVILGTGYVFYKGLSYLCDKCLPPPDVTTNDPPCTNIYVFHKPMPPLLLPNVTATAIKAQHQDPGGAWVTDYKVSLSTDYTNLTAVVYDASGNPLATNTARLSSNGDSKLGVCDFSSSLPPQTNLPPARMFRGVAIQ
jgi:hypothetical protein